MKAVKKKGHKGNKKIHVEKKQYCFYLLNKKIFLYFYNIIYDFFFLVEIIVKLINEEKSEFEWDQRARKILACWWDTCKN